MSVDVKFFPQFKHLSSDNKSMVVFDVMTSTLLELDEVSAAFLEEAVAFGSFSDSAYQSASSLLRFRGVDDDHLKLAYDLIEELRLKGLFAERDFTFSSHLLPVKPSYSALTLNIAQSCQLKCEYCFASGGNYCDPQLSPLMSKETGRKAIDFFFSIADKNVSTYRFVFFGGEPLLNWDVIEDLTLYIESKVATMEKKVRFSLTTNAIEIDDEKANFLAAHRVAVLVSIDGDEKLHNQLRPHLNSKINSHEQTRKGISIIKKYQKGIRGRATVTSLCHDINSLISYLREAGCDSSILQPVSCDSGHFLNLSESALRSFVQQLCNLMFDENQTHVVSTIESVMNRLNGDSSSPWACGYAKALTIDSNGGIYACHRLTSNEAFYLGSIDKGIDDEKVVSLRNAASTEFMTGCRTCWARYLCGASCPAESYSLYGNTSYASPYNCYLYQRLYESAIEFRLIQLKKNDEIHTS